MQVNTPSNIINHSNKYTNMIIGPTFIYICPSCGVYVSTGSMASGNTFGAILYSDGKTIAPMMGIYPDLTKCLKCDAIFWLSKLSVVGIVDLDKSLYDPSFLETFYDTSYEESDFLLRCCACFLDSKDCFRALSLGVAETKEEELTIRRDIWWGYNDRVRVNKDKFEDLEQTVRYMLWEVFYDRKNKKGIFDDKADELRWKGNLERMRNLLDTSDTNQSVMLAEIHRNLGDFEGCVNIINSINDDKVDRLKERIIKECELKNKWVVRLN